MLTGQAKTDYQREYMRKRRSSLRALDPTTVRPEPLDPEPVTAVAVLDPGESTHDRLARTPLAELEAQSGWIPNWRREQG